MNIVKYHVAALEEITPDLKEINKVSLIDKSAESKASKFLDFQKIQINKLCFSYNNKQIPTLDNITATINRGEKIAITGPSGSGKSTLINIISCLIKQRSGEILIDGEELNKGDYSEWQRLIGFVPQNVYLTKKTLKENIAFGERMGEIKDTKIKELIKFSQLTDVVENLPNKENTFIGERGVKLSGCQQQRIGIARALYNDPKILIFDEATNALDVLTENDILKSINNLNKISQFL